MLDLILPALIGAAAPLLAHWFDRHRRRAGRRRTRQGDWARGEGSTGAVWLDADQELGEATENGHGDPRSPRA